MTSFSGFRTDSKNYALLFSYTPHGAINNFQYGTGLWEHTFYNSRQQPTEIGLDTTFPSGSNLLQLGYDYGTTNNNGNLRSQTITVNGTTSFTQSYTYDPLNRLATASEGSSWSQTFSYDRYGNRAVINSASLSTSALTPLSLSAFDAASNRILATAAGSHYYDPSGNLTQITDNASTNLTYGYDAENHMVTSSQGTGQYVYNGEGKRVKKLATSAATVYDAAGNLASDIYTGTYSTTFSCNCGHKQKEVILLARQLMLGNQLEACTRGFGDNKLTRNHVLAALVFRQILLPCQHAAGLFSQCRFVLIDNGEPPVRPQRFSHVTQQRDG